MPHIIDQGAAVATAKPSIKIAIDRGGTFTDCLGMVEGREDNILVKNYEDAPIEGIRRILEEATGKEFPRGQKIDTSQFGELTVRMGTTVATNSLLERKGERVALLITEGFAEALNIGLQSRTKIFDLNIKNPDVLYERVLEVSERVTVESYQQSPTYNDDIVAVEEATKTDLHLIRGINGQIIRVLKDLDKAKVRSDLEKLYNDGFRSICVCLARSYTFQDHELEIQKIATEIGSPQITLSCLTLPMIKMISRGMSATTDAYLTPVVREYIRASLSIRRVIIHRYSSILLAYGTALADTVDEAQRPASGFYTSADAVKPVIEELRAEVDRELQIYGYTKDRIKHEVYLNLRYQGTDNSLMILEPEDGDYLAEFTRQHYREYSFTFPEKNVLLEDIRVRGVGQSPDDTNGPPHKELDSIKRFDVAEGAEDGWSLVYFSQTGWTKTPIYRLETLKPGCTIQGPATIIDNTQTIIVEPRVIATTLSRHAILDLPSSRSRALSESTVDPISLSIFGHRFMSIAEQMGRTFQKTAVSINIKERLDFSCALFSPEGRLVANAPHVPVHLGSMEYAVRYQSEKHRAELKPGDVLCSNHPVAGGVHLPDITIMTPIWDTAGENIIFWVASRGHHPDVGGISPGSMPSNSKYLF